MSPESESDRGSLVGIQNFLIDILRVYSKNDELVLTADTSIEAAGIDSFDFVEILFKIEDHFGIEVDYNANLKFAELKTVGDLAGEIFKIAARKAAA